MCCESKGYKKNKNIRICMPGHVPKIKICNRRFIVHVFVKCEGTLNLKHKEYVRCISLLSNP